ncbi:uncharacterized protein LOC123320308 [Coccinella septempunctata]|uniref:uncharacterized protein LOC123320308 n=1 Tax=Coccinella septempunctata TaxID=41139 RepID=UPI001D068BDF|nr:uncharacterized protein LOC123320308 [Coccinella septempunctata]XP_044763538.1 uncharacterized protein LOC123320308 [Coccinella septempunctata]
MDPADLLKLENYCPQVIDEKLRNEAKKNTNNHACGTSNYNVNAVSNKKDEDTDDIIDVDNSDEIFEITPENYRLFVDPDSIRGLDENCAMLDRIVNDYPDVKTAENKAYRLISDPSIFDENIVHEEVFLDSEKDTDDDEEWTDEEVLNYDWSLVDN